LKVGDRVTLRIIRIEDDIHRIGLSMRRVDSAQYADQDWKALAKEIDITSAPKEETLADMVESIPQVEEPSEAEPITQTPETEQKQETIAAVEEVKEAASEEAVGEVTSDETKAATQEEVVEETKEASQEENEEKA